MTARAFDGLRRPPMMPIRRGGFWRWRWSTTGASAALRRRLVGSRFRSSAARSAVLRTVLRFNAEGPEGLIDRKAPGARPKLDAAQRQVLAARVERGPIPAVDGVVRWRLKDLTQWVFEEFGIILDEDTLGRYLKAMGFRKISARPRHAGQNELAMEAFKKTSRPRGRRSAPGSRPARP